MLVRMRQRAAVSLLLLGENPLEKRGPLALEHAADALDLDQVAAEADQEAAGGKRMFMQGCTTEYTGMNTERIQTSILRQFPRDPRQFMDSSAPSSRARPPRCR